MKRRNFFRTLSGGLLGLVGVAVLPKEKVEQIIPTKITLKDGKISLEYAEVYSLTEIEDHPSNNLELNRRKAIARQKREMAKVIFDDMLKL